MGDEFKQDIGLLVTLFDIAKIIQNQRLVLVEFLQGVFQLELLPGLLQLLHQGGLVPTGFDVFPASLQIADGPF